jgi:hypothetical protein
MTVKELIKQLKKCSQNAIVSGPILGVQELPGYYDGACHYVEGDKYIISTECKKVVFDYMDLEDFIDNNEGDYSKVIFKIKNMCDQKGYKKRYIERMKKASNEYKKYDQESIREFTFELFKWLKKGYNIIQPAKVPIGHYNSMWFLKRKDLKEFSSMDSKDVFEHKLRQGDCHAVLKSGLFKPVKNKDIIVWELKIK